VHQLSVAIGRPVDAVVFNVVPPSEAVLWPYAREHKHPMQLGIAACRLRSDRGWILDGCHRAPRPRKVAVGRLGRARSANVV
jgi:hypothetical protein